MTRPNLRDLPEELVSNISLRLWSDDVQALRLTCKALEQKTLHEWATEYFSEKAFIISSDSLKVLLNIANSAKFRGFLQRMHILTAYFSESAFTCGKTCPYGHCCGWQPTIRQREAWNFLCQDQKDLKASGKDSEMLTEALKKLPALKDISLVDSTSPVPISVDIRMLRKVARLCGRNFQTPTDSTNQSQYHDRLSFVWTILTTAIANSGITTLTRFGTNLGRGNDSLCIPEDLRFSGDKIKGLQNAFKNLTNFRMHVTAGLPRNASAAQKQGVMQANPLRVTRFASVFPPLRSLSLDFDSQPTDNKIFSDLTQHLDLSKMAKLQLNMLSTDRRSLIAVLDRLESVQDLYLNFVNLAKGSWIPILKRLQGMGRHLVHLHLMYLLEANKKAYFLAQPDEDEEADEEDMTFDDMLMSGADDDLGDEDDTDDELPPLETMDGEVVDGRTGPSFSTAPKPATVEDADEPPALQDLPSTSASAGPSSSSATSEPTKTQAPKPGSPDYHASLDHKAPGNEGYAERGYYVCIRGKEEISKQLKTFAQEYNVGENVDSGGPAPMGGMMGGMGGMGGGMVGGAMTIPVPVGGPPGQPPNMNNFLNGLAASLGLPSMPAQNGGAATTNNANANAANTANLANAPNGTQNNTAQAAAGAGVGGSQDDEWDTDEGSEFESEPDE